MLAVSTENLKILSLGRNNLKSLAGLEQVAETLEQLWISYCLIEKLKGVSVLKKVKVLYMSNNKVKDWKEFDQLKDMTSLVELTFMGNPLHEKHEAEGGMPHHMTLSQICQDRQQPAGACLRVRASSRAPGVRY